MEQTGGSGGGDVATRRVTFGRFELDLDTGALSKDGQFVPLKAQAAKVLAHLVARAERLVPRQELIELLWPDRVVEYDQGLNSIIRALRLVLDDDPQAPRYIETLPRQGYRFAVAVTPVGDATAPWTGKSDDAAARSPRALWLRPLPLALSVLAVALAAVSLWVALRSPARETPVLAVLPFAADGAEAQALGESLAGELARELVATSAGFLEVVGEASAARASVEDADPSRVGARLGATHVVTGTVEPAGGRVALEVTLMRVSDGDVLLHETTESQWTALLTAQQDIARRLARHVVPWSDVRTAAHPAPDGLSAETLEDYTYGRYLLAKGSPEACKEAVDRLQSVVRSAPRFARGRVALAEALLTAGAPDAFTQARLQAIEALRLDPREARAHLLRARLALSHEWDWDLAERHLDRAQQLAPGDPLVHLGRAIYAASLGRHAEALAAASTAKRLDPLSATVQGDLAMLHYWAGNLEDVLKETARLLELEPGHRWAMRVRLKALLESERWEEARSLAVALCGEDEVLTAASGPEIEARYLEIQETDWRARSAGASQSMALAMIAARRHDPAAALEHLKDAIRNRHSYAPFLAVDPDLRPFLSDPAFRHLLTDVGHPLMRRDPEQKTGEAALASAR